MKSKFGTKIQYEFPARLIAGSVAISKGQGVRTGCIRHAALRVMYDNGDGAHEKGPLVTGFAHFVTDCTNKIYCIHLERHRCAHTLEGLFGICMQMVPFEFNGKRILYTKSDPAQQSYAPWKFRSSNFCICFNRLAAE